MASDFLSHLARLRDSAIVNHDMKSVNKYNDAIDDFLELSKKQENSIAPRMAKKKSSRFTVSKRRPNVSRESSSMGYAKPIHNQRILSKYNCMVTGEKRMNPCAGCSNVQGCISNSMQYKEHQA
jgi:hypothetical protein